MYRLRRTYNLQSKYYYWKSKIPLTGYMLG
jgi:hypothetical protein